MRALLLTVLIACNDTKETKMAEWNPMDNDPALAQQKITMLSTTNPVQYGQSLQVSNAPANAAIATVAKDLARWRGKSGSDIQPVRVYLGPWQPLPNIDTGAVSAVIFNEPTPWMIPQPRQLEAFIGGQLYARISFGAGGVQHQAYVDWPPRGLLLQVSTNYVQVDGLGNLVVPLGLEENLPRIAAHISPEPGGGDSVQPATYTYPPSDVNPRPGQPPVIFQVPPFARAFRPLFDQRYAIDNVLRYDISVTPIANGIAEQVWRADPTVINDFNRDDYPLDGMAKSVVIQAIDAADAPFRTINVGCMFLLDL